MTVEQLCRFPAKLWIFHIKTLHFFLPEGRHVLRGPMQDKNWVAVFLSLAAHLNERKAHPNLQKFSPVMHLWVFSTRTPENMCLTIFCSFFKRQARTYCSIFWPSLRPITFLKLELKLCIHICVCVYLCMCVASLVSYVHWVHRVRTRFTLFQIKKSTTICSKRVNPLI